ncbi:17759_t:CDS:2 [Acaulospora morrowiae]|uniref:17759_t:CDS:1 n=1 Tax=Acaulospora morrowiae TaxID=94023 RepID=A0A9N9BB56_9GLOM|nr:17759_t:CDS:2 [Acaulospora morrowiae]
MSIAHISLTSDLVHDISKIQNDSHSSDIEIVLPNGQKILCHKLILSSRSSTFRNLLSITDKSNFSYEAPLFRFSNVHKMKSFEINQLFMESLPSAIQLEEFSQSLKPVFAYLYTGMLNWDNYTEENQLFALLIIIKKLELEELVFPVLENLNKSLSTRNAIHFFNLSCEMIDMEKSHVSSSTFNSLAVSEIRPSSLSTLFQQITEICYQYLRREDALNSTKFSIYNTKSISFSALRYYLVRESNNRLTSENIGRHEIVAPTRDTVAFRFLVEWIKTHENCEIFITDIQKDELFGLIDLSAVGPKVLLEEVIPSTLISLPQLYDAMKSIVSDVVKANEQAKKHSTASTFSTLDSNTTTSIPSISLVSDRTGFLVVPPKLATSLKKLGKKHIPTSLSRNKSSRRTSNIVDFPHLSSQPSQNARRPMKQIRSNQYSKFQTQMSEQESEILDGSEILDPHKDLSRHSEISAAVDSVFKAIAQFAKSRDSNESGVPLSRSTFGIKDNQSIKTISTNSSKSLLVGGNETDTSYTNVHTEDTNYSIGNNYNPNDDTVHRTAVSRANTVNSTRTSFPDFLPNIDISSSSSDGFFDEIFNMNGKIVDG